MEDRDEVSRVYLNRLYGTPPSTVSPDINLFPTIAIYSVRGCDKGPDFASTFANDIQAKLTALLVTLKHDRSALNSRSWTYGYNPSGTKYGDNNFLPLSSFKKR